MKSIPCLLAVLAAFSSAVAASKPVPPLPSEVPGSETILLGVASVRKDIGVNSLQRAVLDSLREQYRDEAREIVAGAGDTASSRKAAQSKLDAVTDSYDARSLNVLNSDQRERLLQIEHQILGGYMLLSPALQKELALAPKQKETLAAIWDKGRKFVSKVNGQFEKGEISYAQKMRELHDDRVDRAEDMLDVLTDAQREKFDKLSGAKFVG